MEFSQNDFSQNGFSQNDFMESDTFFYLICLGILSILGYGVFFHSESFLKTFDIQLMEIKDFFSFYTNKIILDSNMEGGAIKNTQLYHS